MMKYVSLFLAILIQNFEVASQSAEQLIEQANLSLANRDVDQSIALCNTLLQLTSVGDNYYLEAWSILGDAYLRVGLYDSSYKYNQKILGYTGSERSKEQLYKASNFIGFYHIIYGNLDSTRYYANSVIANEKTPDYHSMDSILVTSLSDAHYLLALVHRTRGLLDSCVNEFQRSLLIKEEAFGKRSQAVIPSIREIAATFRYDSQYDSALKYIRRALELDQKYQDQSPSLYYEAGVIYSLNLQYRKGLDYFEYALDIREKNNFPADINGCNLYQAIGLNLMELNDYPQALAKIKAAIKIGVTLNYQTAREFIAGGYKNLAQVYSEMDQMDSALFYLDKAETIEKKFNIRKNYLANTYYMRGDIYLKNSNYEKSKRSFAAALKLYLDYFGAQHLRVADIHNKFLEISVITDQLDSALIYFDQAVKANSTSGSSYSSKNLPPIPQVAHVNALIKSLVLGGRTYEKQSVTAQLPELKKEARNFYLMAEELLKQKTSEVSNHEDLASVELLNKEIYGGLISVAETPAEKFMYSEKSKNLTLKIKFQNLIANHFTNAPTQLIKKEKTLLRQRDQIRFEKGDPQDYLSIQNELDSLTEIYKQQFPDYYDIRYREYIMPLNELQQAMDEEELIIEYHLSRELMTIFLITKTSVNVIDKPIDKSFHQDLSSFRALFRAPDQSIHTSSFYSSFTHHAYSLFDQLLGPFYAELTERKGHHLLIIPDDQLSYIPFEVLTTASTPSENFKDLPYLLHDFDISYDHSATRHYSSLLDRDRKIRWSNRVAAFAPSYTSEDQPEYQVTPLKWNADEVMSIEKYYTSDLYLASEAEETAFKKIGPKHSILHFAAHAVIDHASPMLTRIHFEPDRDTLNDGLLHLYEIINMDLSADMAVLSTCDSNFGNSESGSGLTSLSNAFTYAGVDAIVCSNWPLQDKEGKEVIEKFYYYLQKGETKSGALRMAKLDFLKSASPIKSNPYYWANLLIIGDNKTITPSLTSRLYPYRIVAIIIAILLSTIALRYFLKRKNTT